MKTLIALLVAVLLQGCATVSSFDDRLVVGYGTVTAIRTTAATALDAKIIKVDDAKTALKLTDTARDVLDEARTLKAIDLSTATGKLDLATSVIGQVQKFLTNLGAR